MSDLQESRGAGKESGTASTVATAGVGLLYLVLGAALLLHGLDVISLRWQLVGPALIVLLGVFLLVGGLAAARR